MAIIGVIGSGNVAWHLSRALHLAGHSISLVYSRDNENAEKLASLFPSCKSTTSLDFSTTNVDYVIIAISDYAFESMVNQLVLPPTALVAHTSGTLPLTVLEKFPQRGVFYPIQTFTKDKEVTMASVPFAIEANEERIFQKLVELACSISNTVVALSSAKRAKIHLAAVFACNFTNHLLGVASEILQKEKLSMSILEPLVYETIGKSFELGAKAAQTGPARRNDSNVMEAHLEQLKDNQEWQAMYVLLSNSIQQTNL